MTDSRFISRAAPDGNEAASSGVSWPAIIAGAMVASALSLALLMLGAGLGLVSVSPWSNANVSVATFGMLAAAWFIAVQLFTSGVGGYLAGRLRARWVSVHTDEVYFRDTAHGLIVWAVGAVITALLLTSAASSVASGVAHAGASVAQAAGSAAAGPASELAGRAASNASDPTAYFTDMLFRTDHPAAPGDSTASQGEMKRILATDALSGDMPAADKTYVAQVVAARTGLSQADAEKRVSDVVGQAKSAKDKAIDAAKTAAEAARKTGVYVALWAFISLLVGAFSASYMATVGGRIRDDLPMTG
ncbi:hypothetical protein [Methylocapsa sp. S129]|uniref:hypothetical protein n=1 Tax=Methylocapsa sp. S129 TaxID=1641869 RepID=UPI00131C23C9|nr:hypothetical protein [Methylocapsa sp. S129]